jgi:hypothetical protein
MSTCISREGEYSEHRMPEPSGASADFVCRRCFAFDENAAMIALGKAENAVELLRAQLAAVDQLADAACAWRETWIDQDEHGRRSTYGNPQHAAEAEAVLLAAATRFADSAASRASEEGGTQP